MENSFNLNNFIKATTYFATIKESANIYKEANSVFENFFNVDFSMFVKKNNSYEILESFSRGDIDILALLEKSKKFIDEVYKDGFLISDMIDEFFIVIFAITINNRVTSTMLISTKEPISKDGLNILLSISKTISLFLEKQVTKNIFNILSENVPEMLYRFIRTKTREKRFEYIGKGSKLVLGFFPEELTKNPNLFWGNIDKRDKFTFFRAIVKAIKTNQKLSITFRWCAGNENIKYIQTNAMVNRKNGEVIFNGAASNITKQVLEHKKNETILKAKQNRITMLLKKEHFLRELLQIIAKVNELLIISSSTERLLYDSCIELSQYKKYKLVNIILSDENKFYSNKDLFTKDEIENENEFLKPLEIDRVLKFKVDNLKNEKFSIALKELKIKTIITIPLKQNAFSKPFGILLVFNISSEFLKDEEKMLIELAGDIGFAINSFRQKKDLIELNKDLEDRVAKEVAKQREQEKFLIQQSKLASMGEMIGNIAHQWRQPLNILGLQIQDMAEAYDYGELNREYMDRVISNSMDVLEKMSHTIDDFRNFFEPNKKKKKFSIKSAIEKSISIIDASLKNNFIKLEINIINDSEVFGFENEYSQVLLNILNNAKDALKKSDIRDKKIIIEAKSKNSKSIVSITDNGGGISIKIIDKIFEPYFSTKHQSQGAGIGLYMSKMIIEKSMQGVIKVQNVEVDGIKGAKFIIEI